MHPKSEFNGTYIRTEEYYLPSSLHAHVETVFNTVQIPPVIHKHFHKLKAGTDIKSVSDVKLRTGLNRDPGHLRTATSTGVTIENLNSLYGITSNTGNSSLSQAVFETADEYYSPADVAAFQNYFGLHRQAAKDVGGDKANNAAYCEYYDCSEGNLDLQVCVPLSSHRPKQC